MLRFFDRVRRHDIDACVLLQNIVNFKINIKRIYISLVCTNSKI